MTFKWTEKSTNTLLESVKKNSQGDHGVINWISVGYDMQQQVDRSISRRSCYNHFQESIQCDKVNKEDAKSDNDMKDSIQDSYKPRARKGHTLTAGDTIWWYCPHGFENDVWRASIITEIWLEPRIRNGKTPINFTFWPKYSRCRPSWNTKIKLSFDDDSSKHFKLTNCNFVVSKCVIQLPSVLKQLDQIRRPQLNSLYRSFIKDEHNCNDYSLSWNMRKNEKETGIAYSQNNVNKMSDYFSLTQGLGEFDFVDVKKQTVDGKLTLWKTLKY